jgi:hypothetical protein
MNKEALYLELDVLLMTLALIQEEQTVIKQKLSDLLGNLVSTHFVVWAEEIHQQMLNREDAIALLRKDIIMFKKTIVLKKSVIYFTGNQFVKMITKYKEQLVYLVIEFNRWSKVTNERFDTRVA